MKSYILHIITLILVILFFISINVSAQAPGRVINFQGRLTDQQGNPLDGTYDIIFSIYPSDPNSVPLWTESHTDVNVSNGIVNVLLGSKESLDEPQKVTFDQERYLGITIDCDHDPNTKEDEMTPRQRILPALYSYNADRLDGRDSSEFTTPQTDAGRPGVVEHLYEGSMRLVDKYIKQADEEKFQKRVTGSCSSEYSIRAINADGSVLCEKDDYLSKSTVQQWANEVDDGQGGSWIPLCLCWIQGANENAIGCPSRCSAVGGKCTWHIRVWGIRGDNWSNYCSE